MAYQSKTVQSIEDDDKSDQMPDKATKGPKGPPPQSPRPRSASDSSLFSTAGKAVQQEGKAGLGAEGSNPNIIGTQGLALVQRGVQMLNLAFPENPGLVAVLGDLMGRLQIVIPQLVAGSANTGMGLFGNNTAPPPPPAPPMDGPPMGAPPMGGPMPPPQGMGAPPPQM